MVPIKLEAQLPEGSLEYALHHLIEERVLDAWFEELYANDEIGRPAYSPKLLLKVILLGYARGINRLAPAGAGLPGEHHLPRPGLRDPARSQHPGGLRREAPRPDRVDL